MRWIGCYVGHFTVYPNEVKLAQKSIAVAQENENNMAERQCASITI